MNIKNPFLHYPRYLARIYRHDGKICNVRGTSLPELVLPGEDDEIITVVVESQDEARKSYQSKMLVDGLWGPYDAEVLAEMLRTAEPEEEPEEEPGEEPGEEPEVEEACDCGACCYDEIEVEVETDEDTEDDE